MSKIEEIVNEVLEEVFRDETSLFLISSKVAADNQIRIILDGDKGVTLQDCMKVSRAIEQAIDRDEVDFSLEVTSAGATEPLILARQYNKHIGRKLSVKSGGRTIEGTLTGVDGETVTLEWKSREPKPVGKGKVTVQKKEELAISEIDEAKVILKF